MSHATAADFLASEANTGPAAIAELVAIARAAMGGALAVLRLHYADDRLFYSIAEDPLGLSRPDVVELLEFAQGNGSEPTAIPV